MKIEAFASSYFSGSPAIREISPVRFAAITPIARLFSVIFFYDMFPATHVQARIGTRAMTY